MNESYLCPSCGQETIIIGMHTVIDQDPICDKCDEWYGKNNNKRNELWNSIKDNYMDLKFNEMKKAIEFYHQEGFRVMPLYGVHEKCKHTPVDPTLDCRGQCWGKVPMFEHWPDRDFIHEDFKEGCNIALILGKQLDGRWFMGIDIDGDIDINSFVSLPETLECSTNRGRHLVYEIPADTPLGNWNDIFRTRSEILGYKWGYSGAVDIKYCRGAMTSPPSMTKNNTQYTWKEWRQPIMLESTEINYLIRKRRFAYPNVKRYKKWSLEPSHKDKRP